MKYECPVCGYVYDEDTEGVAWDSLPDDWECPICGASKAVFAAEQPADGDIAEQLPLPEREGGDMRITPAELSAICSNLARGCEKQYMDEERELFAKLAEHYASLVPPAEGDFKALAEAVKTGADAALAAAKSAAAAQGDRGALRALVWLCLFAALSTGNVNRVMPVHNLAPALAIGASALLFDAAIGVWRLCCLVLLLLGTVLMESRQQKGRGYRWLLFACLALAGTAARDVLCARLLPNVPDSLQNLMEAFVAMLALWVLSAAGRTFGSLKKLQPESWLFLLLAGASTGVALLCDASAARLGDSTYLLPISCLAFPLMFLFARVIHKEKTPAAAVLGLLLAVFGMFGLLLNV